MMNFAMRSALTGMVVIAAAAPVAGQDSAARTWELCTTGPTVACARLSLRTAAEGTGTRVDIGVTNLQGSNVLDNTGGWLLTGVQFIPFNQTYSWDAFDSGRAGITASGNAVAPTTPWEMYRSEYGVVGLYSAASPTYNRVTANPLTVTSQYYSPRWYEDTDYGNGYWSGLNLITSTYTQWDYDHYYGGYTGLGGTAHVTTTLHGGEMYDIYQGTPSYETAQVCVSSIEGECVDERTGYRPLNEWVKVGERHELYHSEYSDNGLTPGDDTAVWFSYLSDYVVDARDIAGVDFQGYGSDGSSIYCYGRQNHPSCRLQGIEDPGVIATPEPVTMTLLATGLAGIAAAARRRRIRAK
jgi:hypothetical protein